MKLKYRSKYRSWIFWCRFYTVSIVHHEKWMKYVQMQRAIGSIIDTCNWFFSVCLKLKYRFKYKSRVVWNGYTILYSFDGLLRSTNVACLLQSVGRVGEVDGTKGE